MGGTVFEAGAGLGAGITGGALAGLFGVGGGIVLIPLLIFLLGMGQHQAQGVTLAILLLPNSLPAVAQYWRRGIRVPLGLVLAVIGAFLPGVAMGARLAVGIPEMPLKVGFVLFLLAVAARTFWTGRYPAAAPEGPRPAPDWRKGLAIGLLGGLTSGLLGIGGGVVMIPFLVLWVGLTQHEAQLASMLILLPPVGLPGVLVYLRATEGFPWHVAAGVAAGFALGAFFGARLATRLSGPKLQRLFAGVMVLLALLLFARA